MPLVSEAYHNSARTIGEQECGGAVFEIDHLREGLGTDHEDVRRGARADQRVGLADAIAKPGAGGGDVVGGGVGGAQLRGQFGARPGVWSKWETVDKITVSMLEASMPARSMAMRAAAREDSRSSPSPIQRRSAMPVRC